MTLIEAAKQALEALTESKEHIAKHKRLEAVAALNQAIAEAQQQDPVGQLLEEAFGRGQVMWFNKPADQSMLYTSPQRGEAEAPKRQEEGAAWQGLTYEEAVQIIESFYGDEVDMLRSLEAKLKQKNGYAEEKNT